MGSPSEVSAKINRVVFQKSGFNVTSQCKECSEPWPEVFVQRVRLHGV